MVSFYSRSVCFKFHSEWFLQFLPNYLFRVLVFLTTNFGLFSSCMNWNYGFNFFIYCSRFSCSFLKSVIIVTFLLAVLQVHITIISSWWYGSHSSFACFSTDASFYESKFVGSSILILYETFSSTGCLSWTAVLSLITYTIFL